MRLRRSNYLHSALATLRVARTSHPVFFDTGRLQACATALLIAAALILALHPSVASAITGAGYRLAGVVAVGSEHLGFLEVPAGEQVLIRKGGEVPGGGRVVAFDGRTVRIAFPDGMIELVLEGAGAAGGYTSTTGIVTAQEGTEGIYVRTVAAEPLRVALQQSTGTAAAKPAVAIQRRGRTDEGAAVAQRFSALVNLPAGSRVLSVNEQPVGSAAAAIETVNRTLASGMPARLNISNATGSDQRVYLLPARD
jgi:hypothetical protein